MTQIRCRKCRHFFDKLLPACDECGAERYGFNVHLRVAGLNSHLYGMAEKASGPDVSAYQAAREYATNALS